MKKFFQRLFKFGSNLATSKATQKAATVVVDKVGPHTALKKFGLVVALAGLVIALAGWFFLSSWWSVAVTGSGIVLIVVGMAMRSVNNILINLLVRLFKGVINRLGSFAQKLKARYTSAGKSKESKSPGDNRASEVGEQPSSGNEQS